MSWFLLYNLIYEALQCFCSQPPWECPRCSETAPPFAGRQREAKDTGHRRQAHGRFHKHRHFLTRRVLWGATWVDFWSLPLESCKVQGEALPTVSHGSRMQRWQAEGDGWEAGCARPGPLASPHVQGALHSRYSASQQVQLGAGQWGPVGHSVVSFYHRVKITHLFQGNISLQIPVDDVCPRTDGAWCSRLHSTSSHSETRAMSASCHVHPFLLLSASAGSPSWPIGQQALLVGPSNVLQPGTIFCWKLKLLFSRENT